MVKKGSKHPETKLFHYQVSTIGKKVPGIRRGPQELSRDSIAQPTMRSAAMTSKSWRPPPGQRSAELSDLTRSRSCSHSCQTLLLHFYVGGASVAFHPVMTTGASCGRRFRRASAAGGTHNDNAWSMNTGATSGTHHSGRL